MHVALSLRYIGVMQILVEHFRVLHINLDSLQPVFSVHSTIISVIHSFFLLSSAHFFFPFVG
jgi:hypothetical protein